MKFIYAPEGAEPKSWDFDPAKMHDVEAIEIEKRTGLTYVEFGEQFLKGSVRARKALLFVLMKREIPTLKWDELQFTVGEVDVAFDDDEKARIVAALQEKGDLDESERESLNLLLAEGVTADPDPKG